MRIFGFNITRSPRIEKTFDAYSDAWLRGQDVGPGIPALTNAYEQVVWVYRAINVLAEQIGNIPFLFSSGERGRENLITSGPLVSFYDQPHPQINRFQYWELRIIWLMLRGECFRVPIYEDARDGSLSLAGEEGLHLSQIQKRKRKIKNILILNPAHFHHIIDNHELIGWRYTGFGRETPLSSQVFLPEEVWFEKLPNPFHFWRGLGPLQVAGLASQTDFAAGSFMKGVIENNGDLGLVVRMQDQSSAEQREQLKAALHQRKRRAGKADEPLLLWNTAEIVQPRLSSGDLQFLENRKFSRAEICAAFGVPEEIVTTTDNSKYDVVSGARLNFIEHRIAPLCRRLEAGEDKTIKLLDPQAVGWFDLDSLPIMQKAQRDRLATARSVFDMGVPFNELNRVLDLGFRKLPWGDRGYVPANLLPVGAEARSGMKGNSDGTTAPELNATADAAQKEFAGSEIFHRLSWLLDEIRSTSLSNEAEANEGVPVPIAQVVARDVDGSATGLRTEPASEEPLLSDSSSGNKNFSPEVIRRFQRWLFEQRGRVLAKLAQLTPFPPGETALAALWDAVAEEKLFQELKLEEPGNAQPESALRSLLKEELTQLRQTLNESLRQGVAWHETRQELARRLRSTFNQFRNPKIEIRKKSETRDPKPPSRQQFHL